MTFVRFTFPQSKPSLIATAPLDGTEVLLMNLTGTMMQGAFDGTDWRVVGSGTVYPDPTHWLPVPPQIPDDLEPL